MTTGNSSDIVTDIQKTTTNNKTVTQTTHKCLYNKKCSSAKIVVLHTNIKIHNTSDKSTMMTGNSSDTVTAVTF